MLFVNLTPHFVVVRPACGGPEMTLRPSGQVARCQVTAERIGDLDGIPLYRQVFGSPTGIPESVEDTVYVTSTLVAQAACRPDVVSPDTGPTAFREGGQVVAVRGFQTFSASPAEQAVAYLAAEWDRGGNQIWAGDGNYAGTVISETLRLAGIK
jgi:hypothetical protein